MTDATIPSDVDKKNTNTSADAEFDAMAEYLKRHGDKDDEGSIQKPGSKKVRPRESDETEDDPEDEKEQDAKSTNDDDDVEIDPDDESDAEDDDDDKKSTRKVASDDDEIVVTVDGAEVRVSVKDAKRLVGQEKALTRKSQEVAALRKETEAVHQKYAIRTQNMMEQAKKEWEPFASIDWVIAGQKLTAEEIVALRESQQKAWTNYKYHTEEFDAAMKERETNFRKELQTQAVEAVKQIRDETSQFHIPNWSTETYEKVRDYAIDSGVEAEIVNTIVDPAAMKILWKAMRYDEAKKKATMKVAKASPTQTVKPRDGKGQAELKSVKVSKALQKLKETGDVDDAAAAYLARMNVNN